MAQFLEDLKEWRLVFVALREDLARARRPLAQGQLWCPSAAYGGSMGFYAYLSF